MIDAIKNNVIQLTSLSVILSLSSILISKRFSKVFELLGGIVLALFILSSLSGVLDMIKDVDVLPPELDDSTDDGNGDETWIKDVSGELCREISSMIQGRFSINGDDIRVSVTVYRDESGAIALKAVSVRLEREFSAELAADIADYISDLTAAPCTVFRSEGEEGDIP